MGKDIVSRIVKKKAGCLLEIKKNQPTLWKAIAGNIRDFERVPLSNEVYKVYKERETGQKKALGVSLPTSPYS
ncbi:hypothetical protein [Parabacteroides sp.]